MAAARHINGISALEMTMRDVMDNMADLGCQYAYTSVPGCFEILSIEPPKSPVGPTRRSADILAHPAAASRPETSAPSRRRATA